jgi:hypothetical protein
MNSDECISLIASQLLLPVQIPAPEHRLESVPLVAADRPLAQHYLRSTSARSEVAAALPWWLAPGDSLFLLEYVRYEDIVTLPRRARHVRHLCEGAELAHCRFTIHGRSVSVWLLGYDPGVADYDFLRRLRLLLFRFHAELEVIKQVFRLVAEGKIGPKQGSPSSERLQRYLLKSTALLSKDKREGIPQSELLDVVQQLQDIVAEGERATLLDALSDIRPSVLRNVERLTEPRSTGVPVYQIRDSEITFVEGTYVEGEMRTQNVTISGSTIHGDVNTVAAKVVHDSFQRIEAAARDDDLKVALKSLTEAVTEMLKALPQGKQEEAARDLEALVQEAVSPTPRRKWYELSAEGLLEAARTVGDMAGPVITGVKGVLALLV